MTVAQTEARILFHSSLYDEGAIREAAEAFSDFARFSIESEGEHFLVRLQDIDQTVEADIAAEFSNFALANTAIRRKG